MKEAVKRLLRFYYHHSTAYSLMTLPLNGLGALSSLLVLFTLVSGVKFPGWTYAALFLTATIVLFLIGTVARKTGMVKYWTSLANSQNPELMEIYQKTVVPANRQSRMATIIKPDVEDPFEPPKE